MNTEKKEINSFIKKVYPTFYDMSIKDRKINRFLGEFFARPHVRKVITSLVNRVQRDSPWLPTGRSIRGKYKDAAAYPRVIDKSERLRKKLGHKELYNRIGDVSPDYWYKTLAAVESKYMDLRQWFLSEEFGYWMNEIEQKCNSYCSKDTKEAFQCLSYCWLDTDYMFERVEIEFPMRVQQITEKYTRHSYQLYLFLTQT